MITTVVADGKNEYGLSRNNQKGSRKYCRLP